MAWMISSSPSAVTSHDKFEEVGRLVGSDDEPPVGIFAEVVDDERVLDGVEHVVVGDAMTPSRRMDLHT
jgi:hypothetical protein